MTGQNGSNRPPPEEPLTEEIVRLVAEIETKIEKQIGAKLDRVIEGLRAARSEVKVLSTRVDELGEKVHRTNNIAVQFEGGLALLQQSQETFDRALEFWEATTKAREVRDARSIAQLERAVDLLESRVRQVRDAVADQENARAIEDALTREGGPHE